MIKLFCFPYAGGSSGVFSNWKQYLHAGIELVPVELAGRGKRIHEPLYKDISEVVNDVFQLMKADIAYGPYALFGHSMGCMIAYDLMEKIRNSNLHRPLHLFFSGRGAPHLKREDEKKYHLMNDKDFKRAIIELGGTPLEFFEHPELLELFIPLLKNDFKIAETGIEKREIHPLDESITIFLGKEDDLTAEQCDGWKRHTKKLCSIHYFQGGHFFLHKQTQKMVTLIDHILRNCT